MFHVVLELIYLFIYFSARTEPYELWQSSGMDLGVMAELGYGPRGSGRARVWLWVWSYACHVALIAHHTEEVGMRY